MKDHGNDDLVDARLLLASAEEAGSLGDDDAAAFKVSNRVGAPCAVSYKKKRFRTWRRLALAVLGFGITVHRKAHQADEQRLFDVTGQQEDDH